MAKPENEYRVFYRNRENKQTRWSLFEAYTVAEVLEWWKTFPHLELLEVQLGNNVLWQAQRG